MKVTNNSTFILFLAIILNMQPAAELNKIKTIAKLTQTRQTV